MTGADTKSTPDLIRWICEQAAERAGFSVNAAAVYSENITQTQDLGIYGPRHPEDPDVDYVIPGTDEVASLNILAQVNDAGDEAKTVTIRFEDLPTGKYRFRLSVQTAIPSDQVSLVSDDEDDQTTPSIIMTARVNGVTPTTAGAGYVPTDSRVDVTVKDGDYVDVVLVVRDTVSTNMLSAILSIVDQVSIVYRLASEDQYQTLGSYAAGSAYDVEIRSREYDNLDRIDAELRHLVVSSKRGGEIRGGFDIVEDVSSREPTFRRQRQVVIYPP